MTLINPMPENVKEFLDGQISAPDDACDSALYVAPSMPCSTVDGYMERYGAALGAEARRALRPLHDPAVDPASEVTLRRAPFPAQAHVVAAAAKCLKDKAAVCVVGEMGTGKTLIALATLLEHRATANLSDGFRAIVMCPGHLVQKWAREVTETIPDVRVVVIRKWNDIYELKRKMRRRSTLRMVYVIGRDTAKLGPGWHPVYRYGERDTAPRCVHCGGEQLDKDKQPIDVKKLERNKMFCQHCNEHLWAYDDERVRKWAPASFIHKKMKGYFDYLILDEAHEEKSSVSEQSIAAGALVAATKYQIILTGTLIGGYAEDIRPMLFRLHGKKMKERGYTWEGSIQFIRDYGRIDTIITETEGGSNKTGRGKKASKREIPRPGIMPTLFGDMLLDWTVFISLNEISDALPSFTERVIPVNMEGHVSGPDAEPKHGTQAYAYKTLEKVLSEAVREMLQKNDRRLLATMLQTLLAYADHPFNWDEVGYMERAKPGINIDALRDNQKIDTPADDDGVDLRPKKRKSVVVEDAGTFIPICKPMNLSEDTIYPKEQALIDLLTQEKRAGRQVWIYVQNTNKRDVLARLHKVLTKSGFSGKILRSNTVKPIDREQWIYANGRGQDFIVSHPQLVQTGMDLFDKGGNHNFVTLVFYQTGYQTVTLRQASRRSWRIGQNKPCFVYYLYYNGTMQSQAMQLMGTKIKASMQVEGKFSAEGLAAMCDDVTGIEMALAKKLASLEAADDEGTIRAWERIGGTDNEHSITEDLIEAEAEFDDDDLSDVQGMTEEQAVQEINDLLAQIIAKCGEKK